MTLVEFRQEYPEYNDLSDAECMNMLGQPERDVPEENTKLADAMQELSENFASITTELEKLVKYAGKTQPDLAPSLLALGLQLSNIETAIKSVEMPVLSMPEVVIPVTPQVEWMDVKRDEFNHITRLIPKYKG